MIVPPGLESNSMVLTGTRQLCLQQPVRDLLAQPLGWTQHKFNSELCSPAHLKLLMKLSMQ